MRTALENPNSLKNAVLNIATVGLSANPALAEVYYVPRDGRVCADISYRGLCALATRAGLIKIVKADVVYSRDTFELNGLGREPTHKFNPFSKDRGEVIGVYCVAVLVTGEYLTEVMSLEECYAIRDRTPGWKRNQSGPWRDHEGEMLKKTVIKRAAKLWPKAPNDRGLEEGIRVLNEVEGIDFKAEEAEEKHKKQLVATEAREARATERATVEQAVEDITTISKTLTKGFSAAKKGEFLNEILGVEKFTDLKSKSVGELTSLIEKLTTLIPIEATAEEPPPRKIRNFAPGAENNIRQL